MEFSRQEYSSGLPFPSPGNLSNPGIETRSLALQTDSLPSVSREGRDPGVAFQDPPGCQASSRGEAKDSAVLPSRDADRMGENNRK